MAVCPCLQPRLPRVLQCLLLSMGLLLSARLAVSPAQVSTNITPDSTLRTAVTQDDRVHTIGGGTIRGNNLFHSFDRFDLGTRDTASFIGSNAIDNILSRVTGGHPSNIDGILQSKIPGANLYLLNPSGVMFGPNAILDVKGSFHVSTADFLRFADGEKFSAHLGEESVLTMAPPAAFGFLRENPAGIAMRGSSLHVPEGATLSVVSGNIEIVGGSLTAPGGQMHLASVASSGEVVSSASDQAQAVNVDSFERLGEIALSEAARIDVSGEGGGGVVIRGGVLTLAEGAQITSFASQLGRGRGADISVEVGSLALRDGSLIATATGLFNTGGNVTIKATEFVSFTGSNGMGSLSGVVTLSAGSEDAGHIVIEAPSASLNLEGGVIGSFSASQLGGGTGDIKVEAENLTLKNGGIIGNLSLGGSAGVVEVAVSGTISISGQNPPSGVVSFSLAGDPGELSIRASALHMDGGAIGAPSVLPPIFLPTPASGRGGNVTIEVDTLTAKNGAQISSSTTTAGAAGNVTVRTTDSVTIAGGSRISASTEGTGDEAGDAGDVLVEAKNVTLTEGGQISSGTFGPGQGGNVMVTATDTVTLHGTAPDGTFSSGIVANARGTEAGAGDAGAVVVEAITVTLTDGAQIDSSTFGAGAGGTVTVTATEAITIAGRGSEEPQTGLFSVTNGQGNAGGVFVSAPRLTLEGGRILARTLGDGNAGNIEVRVGQLTLTEGAQIFNGIGNAQASGEILGNPEGIGRGGNLTVSATESIVITGRDSVGFPSGLFSSTQIGMGRAGDLLVTAPHLEMREGGGLGVESGRASRGDAGNLTVEVGSLVIREDADIAANTFGVGQGGMITIRGRGSANMPAEAVTITGLGSGIFTNAAGTGNAGAVVITATDVSLVNRASISATTSSSGTGGDIALTAPTIELGNGAVIAAESTGTGNAGSVSITATDTFLSTDSAVTTAAETAGGGDIELESRLVRLTDSALTAEAQGVDQQGSDGGNVTIRAGFVILDHSQMQANAFGGNGGNIVIEVEDAFLADTETCAGQVCLDASSRLGVAGIVEVSNPTADLSGVVTPLPQTFTQAAALLPQRCAERLQGQPVSTFVLAGRGSVPLQPGGALPSPLYRAEREVAASTGRTGALPLSVAHAAEQLVYTISLSELDFACAK